MKSGAGDKGLFSEMLRLVAESGFRLTLPAAVAVFVFQGLLIGGQETRPPVIKHEPVKAAARGQSVSIRAVVHDPDDAVVSVTLYYAVSKDAAPFKAPMQSLGAGAYVGVIPAGVIADAERFSYYIEAIDQAGLVSETPWYVVKVQSASADRQTAVSGDNGKSSWKKAALVAGVVGAGVAGAVAISQSGGGGSGSGNNPEAGTYSGTATTYVEIPGQPLDYDTNPITIIIDSNGIVSSDNLLEGEHLEGLLIGNDFLLTAQTKGTNYTGEIRYNGTVAGGRITGAIQGTLTTDNGAAGSYSGTFHAVRE